MGLLWRASFAYDNAFPLKRILYAVGSEKRMGSDERDAFWQELPHQVHRMLFHRAHVNDKCSGTQERTNFVKQILKRGDGNTKQDNILFARLLEIASFIASNHLEAR